MGNIQNVILAVPSLIEGLRPQYKRIPSTCHMWLATLEQIIRNEVGQQSVPYSSIFPYAFGSPQMTYDKPNVFPSETTIQPRRCFEFLEFRPRCPGLHDALIDIKAIMSVATKDALENLDGDIMDTLSVGLIRPLNGVVSPLKETEGLLSQLASRRCLGENPVSESASYSERLLSAAYEHIHSFV